jgi:hypothetical protein
MSFKTAGLHSQEGRMEREEGAMSFKTAGLHSEERSEEAKMDQWFVKKFFAREGVGKAKEDNIKITGEPKFLCPKE